MALFLSSVHRTIRHSRRSFTLRWLIRLGGLGLFALAIVDSSMIPLPIPGSTDLALLLLVGHRSDPFLMAACATAGSVVGGYISWSAGRKGGSMVLNHYVPHRFLQPVTRWVERRGRLSICIAALLPPPIPLTPFLLAAGTLGVTRTRFLISFAVARTIRYGLLAWLAATYGRRIIHAWAQYLSGWSQILLWIYLGALVLGVGYGLWKYKKQRPASAPSY